MLDATPLTAAGEKSAQPGTLRSEFGATIKLALPMALTQLGQIAMLTTDMLIVGRLGEDALAAAALGMNMFFLCFIIGMGVVTATAPLAAQAYGARDPRGLRRVIRQGLWAGLAFGAPLSVIQLWGEPLLLAANQDPKLAALAGQYLSTVAWCIVPALWLIVLRNFVSALDRPRSALWVMLAGIPINGFFAYAFVFGRFGMPELGIAGAGLATTLVQICMVLAQAVIAAWGGPFRRYHVFGRFWRSDWPRLVQIVSLGLPISGAIMLEAGVFIAAVLLMGWLGTVPLAAHQIAIQIASVTFMIPFGISQAATVRVGQAVGRQDAAGLRRAAAVALVLGVGFMAAMALALALGRHDLPWLFLDAGKGEAAAVASMAAILLVFAAIFQVFDGAQAIATGALRGLNDTRIPMLLAGVSYWVIGFSLAYVLGFPAGFGPAGIWIGLATGLACAALLLSLRFRRLSQRGYLPMVNT
jgi:MATE family multidrug resistance protein